MTKAKPLFFMVLMVFGTAGAYSQCSDLFFSEYVEGSSSNKSIEVYNPTGSMMDLADYEIHRFNNGSTTSPDILDMEGMLAPYGVYSAVNPSADAALIAIADTLDDITFFNGDDALLLIYVPTNDTLDVIGVLGVDPGSNWPVGTGSTSNHTLTRMTSVGGGSSDWTTASLTWDVNPINDFSFAGSHSSDCESASSGCSDLFISEYVEGSSSNKAIEIYNPTAMAMDLTDYQLHRYNNGGTTNPDTLDMQGMLMAYDVYTAVNPSADALLIAEADTLHSITFYNGDDVLVLLNVASGDTLDIFGVVGVDPGSSWPVGTGSTANHTLVRKQTVEEGTTDWTVSQDSWDVYPNNDFSQFGNHVSNCEILASGCDGVFFSEYIEGSGSNKVLEIYNASGATVDLTTIQIHRYNNGGTTSPDTFDMQGAIAAYDVFLIGNDNADPTILSLFDTTGSATFYNGDDYLLLIDIATNDTLDIFGEFGVDPGSGWPVDTGFTNNFTLVRQFNVTEGTSSWAVSSTQWDVYPINTFSFLGDHDNVCAPPADDTEIEFASAGVFASEGDGSVSFDIELVNPINDTVAVEVMVTAASTATAGADYTFTDTNVVFPANSTGPVTLSVALTDDVDVEADETVVLVLKQATNGAIIGADSVFTLTITDNDYPVYPIGLITADADGDGVADSLDVRCEIRGIVYGVNLSSGGLQFNLRDTTDGIAVFSFNQVSGYVVTEGDSLVVQGEVDSFNGLAELVPDSIFLASSGNPLTPPVVVTVLDESTENEYVQLNCVQIVDTTQWPDEGSNRNVDFTNGVDTFTVRIDRDTDIDGSDAPLGYINLRGIGSQFDSSDPRTEGYQLFPQTLADLIPLGAETAALSTSADATDESAGTYTFEVFFSNANPDSTLITLSVDTSSTATEGTDFSVDAFSYDLVGCGDADTATITVTITDDADIEGDETVVLILASSDTATVLSTDTLTLTITETDQIRDLLPEGLVKAYPNPGTDFIRIESSILMDRALLINLNGQTVHAVSQPSQVMDLNTSELPAGIYLLQVEASEGIWMQRWVKQ